ncbi:hypothetical protein ACFVUS_29495 [Nocardia sp. NPDC058058]|uniref:hypothetical protein n=1 Tax=Nocardia sp. NPDC058058 TaxID=3346317 RepID=UPI0036DC125F
MTNVVLILAVLDIALMTVLVILLRIPPLARRLTTMLVAHGYWRPTWPTIGGLIPVLLLALVGAFWGLVLLL